MKIVHLVAGAGRVYCGSCLHGNTLVRALREAGQDAVLLPVYTPLRTDAEDASVDRVAFGGINVYLQQHSALFRHTPWFLDRLLDRPGLLRWLGKRASSTRPERLGALTVSMLRGEEGRQRKELEKLVRWLDGEGRPDVVHLSNAMLAGMARQLTARLNVPVVCTLSGEDTFLERLSEPHRSEARAVLRERCADLSALVAMSRYCADFMADYLSFPRERIRVIPPGLKLDGHGQRGARFYRAKARWKCAPQKHDQSPEGPKKPPLVIGYLSRICPEKGLHVLAEAFRLLAGEQDLPPMRLVAAGSLGESDRPYLERIQSQLAEWGLADRFRYVGEPDRPAKIAFLESLNVMSVPTVQRETKGLVILEAWASAVPVVLPDHGAFSELIRDTGGGLLCEPKSPPALAAALKRMLLDPKLASECGRQAQEAVRQRYHAARVAERTIELYHQAVRDAAMLNRS
ncbi:MAG: glycosyltransferase family 4 protein [Planctomycetota bacterium]